VERIPFSQVLKNAKVDIPQEYYRLYALFDYKKYKVAASTDMTLREYCAQNFLHLPFRGTCITLDDFDETNNIHFEKYPSEVNLDYLVSFCEYSYNLVIHNLGGWYGYGMIQTFDMTPPINFYLSQVNAVIDKVGYLKNAKDGITDFVPKDQVTVSVSEILDPSLSYKVLEYNHHSMKGKLERKKETLITLANKLEAEQTRIRQINSSLESDLFFLLNNLNIRHNNVDQKSKNYIHFIADMPSDEIEKWYDDTYQLCLLAFLELDNTERKIRIKKLKEDIEKK